MAYVEIKDLVVQTHIGCGQFGQEERATPQNLGLTIKAYFDAAPSYKSDDLHDTVDYMALTNLAKEQAGLKPRHLIESLAHDMAQTFFMHSALIIKVDIHIEKYSTASGSRYVGFADTYQR